MKTLLIIALCAASISSLVAGKITIVSCVPDKVLEVKLSMDGVSQAFKLETSQSSGGFVLEGKSAKVEVAIWGDDTSGKEFSGSPFPIDQDLPRIGILVIWD